MVGKHPTPVFRLPSPHTDWKTAHYYWGCSVLITVYWLPHIQHSKNLGKCKNCKANEYLGSCRIYPPIWNITHFHLTLALKRESVPLFSTTSGPMANMLKRFQILLNLAKIFDLEVQKCISLSAVWHFGVKHFGFREPSFFLTQNLFTHKKYIHPIYINIFKLPGVSCHLQSLTSSQNLPQ